MPGPYAHDPILAADPSNPSLVAANASVTIFAVGDPTKTPVTIWDLSHTTQLPNPVTTNRLGFGPQFLHDTIPQLAWEGGGFSGTFKSFKGLWEDAEAAKGAAQGSATSSQESAASSELAATNAAAGVATALAATVGEATAAKLAAQQAAALVGAPADVSTAALVGNPATLTGTALSAAIGSFDAGYDIIILAGQSNMSGRGALFSSILDPVNGRVFQYKSKAPNANTIVAASEPLDMHDTPSGIGPGLQFARWYASRKLQASRKVLLVPVANGGTALVDATTSGWRRGVANNLYANMVSRAQAALVAAGAGSRIVAALWLQGETDGDRATTGPAYQADFDALINGLRTDLSISDLPFILGTMVPEYISTGTRPQINAVHRDTPNRIARVDVAVSAAGMNNGDGNHFNAPGQRFNGKAMYDAYERISQGIAPYSETYVIPAQVTGLAAGTPASNSVPLTWTAVSGSTYYLMEYRLTGGATWTGGGTATGTSGVVGGLSASTAYDFRVTAGSAVATGTPSATVSATTSAVTLIMGISGAAQAYSLRKISNTYAGPAIKVRRSSDNATLDIGFVSSALDTSALTTFSGAGDAFVATWYDQSGNGRHITQATTASQPKIVAAGVVVTSGGKPAVTFDGTASVLYNTTPALYAAGAATVCQVALAAAPAAAKRTWAESVSTASAPQYGLLQPDSVSGGTTWGRPMLTVNGASGVDNSTNAPQYNGTLAAFNSAIHQSSGTDTGTAFAQWVDGAVDLASVAYSRYAMATLDRFALGGVVRSGSLAPLPMTYSEFASWPVALGTTDRQAVEANQKAFYGTP